MRIAQLREARASNDRGGGKREGRVSAVSWVSGFAEMRKSGSDAGVKGRWTSHFLA